MKSLSKTAIALLLVSILASCNGLLSTPEPDATNMMETALSTVGTALAETQRAIPTETPTSLPQMSTEPGVPTSEYITYYYFVSPEKTPLPERSVYISTTYILAPTSSGILYSPDTADDLRIALETALNDDRNGWESSNVEIVDVTFEDGHAVVDLQGDYYGVGDVTLIAARMQILMTIFANPSVQTAYVTLNGGILGNLGISNSDNSKPADYVLTRAEMEVFMNGEANPAD